MEKKTLAKNAFFNGIKVACSIIFPFISFAYCSRILGSERLGIYSFGQSIVAYLLLIASLGIPNYAIREGAAIRNDRRRLQLFIDQVFTINCIMTLIAYIILAIILLGWTKLSMYKYVILIQSIQIILTTLGTDWINTIFEDYFYLALRYIIIQIISIILLILFVKEKTDIYIYTLISMFSNSGGNILNWHYLREKGIKPKITKEVELKKHIIPIFILFCNSIATIIYLNSDVTMLGIYVSYSAVGIYTVSSKIYSMIKSLLNAIIMVTLPRFSYCLAQKDEEGYKKSLKDTLEILFIMVVPVMVGLFLEAEKILKLIAGVEYLPGVPVVRILSLAIFFATGACFFSYSILMPNRLEKYFLFSTIIAACVNIVLNFIFLPIYDIKAAAMTTLIAEIIVFTISAIVSFRTIKFHIGIENILKTLLGCLCIIFVCIILDKMPFTSSLTLILEILVCIVAYYIILLILRCDHILFITKKFLRIFKYKIKRR